MRLLILLFLLTNSLLLVCQKVGLEVLKQERNFAQMALDSGTKKAFLKYLGTEAIVFSEGKPIAGQSHWHNIDFPWQLSWQPHFVELAASQNLAYTIGTYQFYLEKSQEKPTEIGCFSSIWQKQPDGAWKVILDIGSKAKNEALLKFIKEKKSEPTIIEPNLFQSPKLDTASLNAAVFTADFILSNNLKKANQKIESYSKDAFIFHSTNQKFNYNPIKAQVASSGDLAFVYGFAKETNKNGNYLRIWRREKRKTWKVVLEIVNI